MLNAKDPRVIIAERIITAIGGADVPNEQQVKIQVSDLKDWANTLVPDSVKW